MIGDQNQTSDPAPVTHGTVFQSSPQSYRTCRGTMHAVTASYVVAYVHTFGYLALFIYQLCVAISVGTGVFGGVVYLPCVLTGIFLIGSCLSTVATSIAISDKEPDVMNIPIVFIFSTIIYATYLSIFTILSYSTEGQWLNYMRVQLESKPRFVTGMPEEYSKWKYFQLHAMTDRFILFAVFFMSVVLLDYSSFWAIVTCQSYLSDQAAGAVVAVDEAASQPLIQRPSIEPSAPPTKFEMPSSGMSAPSYGQGVALPPTYVQQSAVDKV